VLGNCQYLISLSEGHILVGKMVKKFVPRERKHKVLARQKASGAGQADGAEAPIADSNALEIVPSKKDVEAKKMREDLKDQGIKVSGKKAKRLEKYIDNKLKNDENKALLAKLANNKVDTSLFFSTRTLGQGKETKKQALKRALQEHKAGLRDDDDEELFEQRRESDDDSDSFRAIQAARKPASKPAAQPPAQPPAQPAAPEPKEKQEKTAKTEEQPTPPAAAAPTVAVPKSVQIGSGLKRPLDLGEDGRPVIQKRQKRGGVASKASKLSAPKLPEPESESTSESDEDAWNGISSEDEDNDSNDAEMDDEDSESDSGSEDEEMSDGDSDDDSDEAPEKTKQRSSAFKAWAHQQRNEALGYEPVEPTAGVLNIPKPENFKPRPMEQDPLPLELQVTANDDRKAYSVPVLRSTEIQEARMNLPVVAEEQKIMEAIHNNNIVVICGATGSGKTTQVPQFLFEAGYGSPNSPTPGLIGVTQPRKVAAVSMSKRVGQELGNHSEKVAYQIRFEGTANEKTAIKFMTDGVLLREVSSDIALRKYSAVIIDEAHERSVNTDILIGMLSRVVKLRQELADEDPTVKPLKLVIMSATLRIDDLVKNPTLFPTPPPVLDVEGRQFPVTIHFARQTKHDYVDELFKKITRGHKKLPPGGMLVFLTGHDEISRLSKKLKQASGGWTSAALPKVRMSANDAPLEVEDIEFGQTNDSTHDDFDELNFIDEDEEDEEDKEFDIPDEEGGTGPLKMHILPLYSLLPTREQMRVFEPPPEGHRQIVIATNVAETSLTIPGTRYVFDCGRAKERRFDKESGVQSYEIGWISKASANQRSGRAGRTGPGHCYRLYSSAVYERDFVEFADPELLKMPIEGVVLQLKAMRLQHVVNFPFPTPPSRLGLAKAERLLTYLSAITPEGRATDIGTTMAKFPLPPRFARILLIGHLYDCMPYTVALVAGLSVQEIFIPESVAIPQISDREEGTFRTNEDVLAETQAARARQRYNKVHHNFRSLDDASDAIKLLQVVGEFAHDPSEQWCENHFVRFRALQEAQKLRKQITSLLQKDIPAFANLTYQDKLDRPSVKQITALKQMVAAGFIDQVAIRGDLAPSPPEMGRKPRRAIDVPYVPLHPIDSLSSADDVEKCVYIHPSSSLSHYSPQECPEYIVYSHLQRASPGVDAVKTPKTRMIALTNVTGAQLAALAKGTPLLTYGKPIKEVKTNDPNVRESYVVPYLRAEGAGGQGWPLPVKKVIQKKIPGKGWVAQ
jgi:ATP-dependent RNA helicase DHX37/DHR1